VPTTPSSVTQQRRYEPKVLLIESINLNILHDMTHCITLITLVAMEFIAMSHRYKADLVKEENNSKSCESGYRL